VLEGASKAACSRSLALGLKGLLRGHPLFIAPAATAASAKPSASLAWRLASTLPLNMAWLIRTPESCSSVSKQKICAATSSA
jgi:hypothetical protein